MFDIGFPELMMISVVALLVIGPEKLPETIRTISLWVGRMQRSFTNIRREIENEIGADEIRAQLHNEGIMKELENAQQTIKDVQSDVNNTIRDARSEALGFTGASAKPGSAAVEQETSTEPTPDTNTEKDQRTSQQQP